MKQTFTAMVILCNWVLPGSAARAVEPSKASNEIWVGNQNPNVQVEVDKANKRVMVMMNKDKERIPKSVTITFINEKGMRVPIDLKTTDARSAQFRFTGLMTPAAQSFVGFEVEIPFGANAPTVIRSADLKKR